MTLPYDYSRCIGSECAIKETCARFTSPGRPDGWQSVSDFSQGGACTNFIAAPAGGEAEKS